MSAVRIQYAAEDLCDELDEMVIHMNGSPFGLWIIVGDGTRVSYVNISKYGEVYWWYYRSAGQIRNAPDEYKSLAVRKSVYEWTSVRYLNEMRRSLSL